MGSWGSSHKRSRSGSGASRLPRLLRALPVLALLVAGVVHAAPRTGDPLPKAIVTDLKGGSVSLPDEFRGKVTLIHFFATWCAYCPKEVAALESLYGRYRDRGLVPCSVGVGESREKVASFGERERISYPLLLDPASSAAKKYGVTGIPTTYVLDASGIVRFRIIGEITEEGLDRIVRGLLPGVGRPARQTTSRKEKRQ
jgi:cytochrome c biogenesis protein CcmG, thiol:disulfide interchange protein DsbE